MNSIDNDHNDDDGIEHVITPEIPLESPVSLSDEDKDIVDDVEPDDDDLSQETSGDESDTDDLILDDEIPEDTVPEDEIRYDFETIDLRGESQEHLTNLLESRGEELGFTSLRDKVRMTGSWENLIYRSLEEENFEERRTQEALAEIKSRGEDAPLSRLRDPDTGKTLLRTGAISVKTSDRTSMRTVHGDEARIAFEAGSDDRGGGFVIPLYNSGITLTVVTPTGNDIQTMLTNCWAVDRELGAANGAHYFTHVDNLYKTRILNFVAPLIINSSYSDWRKKGKLWRIIKLPDLAPLVMNIAAMCYRKGYDGFITRCTRPVSESHPKGCQHTEKMTVNLFDMILTRFSALSESSVKFMIDARMGKTKHSLGQIADYQKGLGFEGQKLTFGDTAFTMRIPSVMEHIESGVKFLSDIVNEVQSDNTDGHYAEAAFRYVRSFIPWIATVEKVLDRDGGGGVRTSDEDVIQRALEKLDGDIQYREKLRNDFRNFINKSQLTYVGYPAVPCAICGYTADTPSGLLTLDPFSAFFTLATLYSKPTIL